LQIAAANCAEDGVVREAGAVRDLTRRQDVAGRCAHPMAAASAFDSIGNGWRVLLRVHDADTVRYYKGWLCNVK
jgi:hypothetical protein